MEVNDEIIKLLMQYPNVVGVSKKLKKKIVKNKETDEMAIRVYVSKKLPLHELRSEHVIPKIINGIKTDVVEIGEVKALSTKNSIKTKKIRPVVFGISIGNEKITAGTNGWLYYWRGEEFFGSNAHVFTPNPSLSPKKIKYKKILQPGPYDGGTENDVVAEYYWHKQIIPEISISNCPVAKVYTSIYNFLAKTFRRKTRLVAIVANDEPNYIDFALAKPVVDYKPKIIGMDITDKKIIGHIFAGSDKVGVFFKLKYVLREGITPLYAEYDSGDVEVGTLVEKSGRTTCHSTAKVIDNSATIRVSYITFVAVFDDVVLTNNPNKQFVQGGDSGSSVWVSA